MMSDAIHQAYLAVNRGGKEKLHPAGRFMVQNGDIQHLEDYHDLLKEHVPEGAVDEYTLAKLTTLPPHFKTAATEDVRQGHRLDVVPEADLQPLPEGQKQPPAAPAVEPPKPPSVFHYMRAGHDQPHVLEARQGKFLLDGNPLKHEEVAAVLDNVRTKAAKLRYVKATPHQVVVKMEAYLTDLRKAGEMDPEEAMRHLHEAAQAGHVPHEAVDALRRHIYVDPMVGGGLGNKYAFQQFQKENRPGVNVVGDANYFKLINDIHGHEAGDAAIKAMGSAWRDAAQETGEGKAHRFGGDEFHVHFPTQEHAHRFARTLRAKLEAIPPVGGTHRLGMSIGIGHNFPTADKALYEAKKAKAGTTPSTVPHLLAHSLVPGAEGPLPAGEHPSVAGLQQQHAAAPPA